MGGTTSTVLSTDSDKENILIIIEWDESDADYIVQSEINGLDWSCMVLYETDLEKSISID